MTAIGIYQILFFFLIILALTKPLGAFMARVFQGERTFLHPVLRPLERLIYRLSGVREDVEQRWTQYAASVLAFSIAQVRLHLPDPAAAGVASAQSAWVRHCERSHRAPRR